MVFIQNEKRLMNKLLFCLFFVFSTFQGIAQTALSRGEIPQAYHVQFEEDQNKYLEFTNPFAEKAGEAYNLWKSSLKGYLRYNKDSLYAVYESLSKSALAHKIEFIKQHPGSYASLYFFNQAILGSTRITPDSLLSIYQLFDKEIQATELGISVSESIQRKQKLLLGYEMPFFSFKTNEGQTVNSASFRNTKNVLLCFWASWCGPCVRTIPLLKKINQAYQEHDLQIISISIDSDSTKWLSALQRHSMPWLQTCDLPRYINNNNLSTIYEIRFIPQYFLINKEGKLIYQSVLNDDGDDYSILSEMLRQITK